MTSRLIVFQAMPAKRKGIKGARGIKRRGAEKVCVQALSFLVSLVW